MPKFFPPVVLAAFLLCSCGGGTSTGPGNSGFTGPVLDANEIAGNWTLELLEVNGAAFTGRTIRGWGSELWTVQALSGTITFTVTSSGGGSFTCSPAAVSVNVADAASVKNSTRTLGGTFGIPEGGALAIVLTSTQSEDPRYQGKPFGGLINFESGKLVIEFKQSTFSRDDKKLYPTYGRDLVDNTSYSTGVVARFRKG